MLFSAENIDELILCGFILTPKKWECVRGPYPSNQQKAHRVILIHKTETELTFLSVQSATDWIKKNMPILDIVCISNKEWDDLTNDRSYIVCRKGSLIKVSTDDFLEDLKNGEIHSIPIPESVVLRIKNSIRVSKTFTQLEKDEILKPV